MKTVENLIFDKRFKGEEFDPNDYNDWAKENEYEAYTLCLTVAKQLQQHLVMQAEGSDVSVGAAVGNSAVGKGVSVGFYLCPVCKQNAGKSYLLSKLPTICQKCDHAWNRA